MDPKLLLLSLALPSASLALGLGDIRVESALHQPLAAQIDLLGATPDDLTRLNAAIADDDMFQRYSLERPAFLSNIALTVSQDKQGHPVLVLRSTEPLIEPVITFLVDLHSPNGELIREYSLLLDPPGSAPPHSGAETTSTPVLAQPVAVAQASTVIFIPPERTVATLAMKPAGDTYTVEPRDTLDRIVRAAGAHTRSDRHRMMLAIFRSNRDAFRSNLNILHSGATLHLPSAAEVAAISADEANREFVAQLASWRSISRRRRPATPVVVATAPNAAVAARPDVEPAEPSVAALRSQVESLQKSLDALTQQLRQPPAVLPTASMAAPVAPAPAEVSVSPQPANDRPATSSPRATRFALPATGLGLALAAGAWLFRRRRFPANGRTDPQGAHDPSIPHDTDDSGSKLAGESSLPIAQSAGVASPAVDEADRELTPADPPAAHGEYNEFRYFDGAGGDDSGDTEPTVNLAGPNINEGDATLILAPRVGVNDDTVEHNFAFFNPESAINTTHVMIASGLHQRPAFVERRKNPADVLRQAIEREPHRSDLRLKLLELYYSATSQNRRAFLEVARQLAKNQQLLSTMEWAQIAEMGRKIAPDDEMFSEGTDHQAVA